MLLQDDPLLDVFVFLCRAMLEGLQLTNRRFNLLVQNRTKGVCLREIDVAELWADADVADMPVNRSKLVTAPGGHRGNGLQLQTFSLENTAPEVMCRWFAHRLRHSVVTDQLKLAVTTDSPDFLDSVRGTVLLKKGLCWAAGRPIDLDNTCRFLSSFIGLSAVELWISYGFRFNDEWFKLFEDLAIYRVVIKVGTCTASTDALISFLFGASSAPASENRLLHTSFKRKDAKTLKAVAEKLIEAAVNCTSMHKTTFVMDNRTHSCHDTEHMRVLAKYKDDLLHYSGSDVQRSTDDEGQSYSGHVLNVHKEPFRIQAFCYSGGLQIRRARVEEVGFFPTWLETAERVG